MTEYIDIIVVGVAVVAALVFLVRKGYRRVTFREAACGGCGGACGGAVKEDGSQPRQVVQSIELLTVVTAADRS
ncbi:MAG: hypothetical protein KDD65_03900 [Bacteroidetes bacterium]|nr:hypothetical protein [Bacteroidota bacterium]